jgi:predicted transcriptional regulator
MLKRHLATAFQLTPQQYRERWGLPADYPMVAPDYASRRSALAKQIGLGRRAAAEPAPAPKKAGRKKATA